MFGHILLLSKFTDDNVGISLVKKPALKFFGLAQAHQKGGNKVANVT
jgi:hypothetical protein